jgi:hypothetical protein
VKHLLLPMEVVLPRAGYRLGALWKAKEKAVSSSDWQCMPPAAPRPIRTKGASGWRRPGFSRSRYGPTSPAPPAC